MNGIDPANVSVRAVRKVTRSGKTAYHTRWKVPGARTPDKTKSHKTRADAEAMRAELLAASRGRQRELFDPETSLPVSWTPTAVASVEPTFLELAIDVIEKLWPSWGSHNRRTRTESIAGLVAVAVDAKSDRAALLKYGARTWLLRPNGVPPVRDVKVGNTTYSAQECIAAMEWLGAHSLPVSAFATVAGVEKVLNAACVSPLTGERYTGETIPRFRSSMSLLLGEAVRAELLAQNNVRDVRLELDDEEEEVDPAMVPTAAQARALVDGLGTMRGSNAAGQYRALWTLLWTTGMRPSEAAGLIVGNDLDLPATGWGRVRVRKPIVTTGSQWTDDGSVREVRDRLKARKRNSYRDVLVPPEAVLELRAHIEARKPKAGDLLFTNTQGNPIDPSAMGKVWRTVRGRVLGDEWDHLRNYEMRHTAASMMLRAGIPVPRVAQQLGHSPELLMRVYARVMSNDDDTFRAAMDRALAADQD